MHLMMIEQIKLLKFKSKDQLDLYEMEKSKLSKEDKYRITSELLNEDVFMYLELISKLILDLAEASDDFITLLEKLYDKIKTDMAQGPFLEALKNIGFEKADFSLKIYKKILSESRSDHLKIISGLILGGYSRTNEKEFIAMIPNLKNNLETLSFLKGAIVLYEKNKELPKDLIELLDKLKLSPEVSILKELANISLIFYDKNKDYFYKILEFLVKKKDNEINYLILSRLTYTKEIEKIRRFNLINLAKDCSEIVIDESLQVIMQYPEETDEIGSLLIYWTNKGLEFRLRNYSWVIEEISKKNNLYVDYFLTNISKIDKPYFNLPNLMVLFLKSNIAYSISKILESQSNGKIEDKLFYEFARRIIGSIYEDCSNFDKIIILLDRIILLANKKKFISFNQTRIDKLKIKPSDPNQLKKNFDELIDVTENILNQLQSKKEEYDFTKITNNIGKYPELFKLSKEVIINCQKSNLFSPILWLGEREEPEINNIKIEASDSPFVAELKRGSILGQYYPRAYLSEIESSIPIYQSIKNGKFNKKDVLNSLKKNIGDEKRFWTYVSEVIFFNNINKKIKVLEIDPQVPNRSDNNLDLKISLFNRDVYFEITRPELDRPLKLSNSAVGLGNKSYSVIDKKYRQMFSDKTYNEIKAGNRKDLFFVVIDTSDSTIDEYGLLNSLFGSFSFTLLKDKATGKVVKEYPSRQPDSLGDKNAKTGLITGVIFFKQNLSLIEGRPSISLLGNIILNPNAINTLSPEEIKELQEIIFGARNDDK